MAKRNRYREMENMMTKVLIADALIFFLYMVCAGRGWAVAKIISVVLTSLISLLSLGWLYITREFFRRRSLWMVTACVSILACLIVSLILGYPCPAVTAVAGA